MPCGNSSGNKICKCNRTSLNYRRNHFWNCFAQSCNVQVLWNSNCTNTRLTDATEWHWSLGKTWEGWRASCRASCITSWNYASFLSSWNKRGKHSLFFRSKYRVTLWDPTGKNFLKTFSFSFCWISAGAHHSCACRMRVKRLFPVLPILSLSDAALCWPLHGESAVVLNKAW